MKNIQINIIIIILSVFTSIMINAQPYERSDYYKEKGHELIKKAGDKIKSYESLILDFKYIVENKENNIHESSPGKTFLKGDKFNISLDDYQYISDGNTVWTYLKDVGEIHVSYAENLEQSMNPVYLLQDFQEHYEAKLIRQENYAGELVYLVDAIPNQPQSFFKYRTAIIDETYTLSYIKAYDRHGGTYKIRIEEIHKNPTISDEKFIFDKTDYPDMDIIDLR